MQLEKEIEKREESSEHDCFLLALCMIVTGLTGSWVSNKALGGVSRHYSRNFQKL